jgi:hypothetical protein
MRVRIEVNGAPAWHLITQCPFLGEGDSVRGMILLLEEAPAAVEAGA